MKVRFFAFLLSIFVVAACSDSERYEVGVVKPLMVISVEPGGAEGVPLDSALTVRFSDPVVEGSLTADTVVLTDAEGGAVETELTWDAVEHLLTIQPTAPLAYSTVYTLTLTQKIKRAEDDAVLAKELVQTFKSENPPNLAVVSSQPSGGATSIGVFIDSTGAINRYGDQVSATVTVTFSDGIDTETLTDKTFVLKDANGTAVAGTFTWDSTDEEAVDLIGTPIGTDDILTFTPDEPLTLSMEYTVTLTGTFDGIRSKRATEDGGWFEEDVVWTFNTIDPPPLTLVRSDPSPQAASQGVLVHYAPGVTTYGGEAARYGNAVSKDIVLYFGESVDTASFAANVTVVAADESGAPITDGTTGAYATGIPGEWVFTASNGTTDATQIWRLTDTATFTPESHWELSGNYVVVVDAALESYRATNVSGSIEQDLQIDFETVHPESLQVLSVSPSDGGEDVGSMTDMVAGTTASHTVEIRFSEAINTALASNIELRDVTDGTVITSTWTFADSGVDPWRTNDTITYNLNEPLSKNFEVVIPAATASYRATSEGGQLGSQHRAEWDMRDPLPLFLEESFPGSAAVIGRSYVDPSTAGANKGAMLSNFPISITFSEAVDAASFTATFKENGLVLPQPTYMVNGTEVTFTANLNLSSTYQIEVPGGSWSNPTGGVVSVRGANVSDWYSPADDNGGYLNGNKTIWFETPDPEPLTITAISPSVDATGYGDNVTRDPVIEVSFSEAVLASKRAVISTLAYLVEKGSGAVVNSTYGFNADGNVLTIDPDVSLDYSTEYELRILGGSTGLASWRWSGNPADDGYLVPTGTNVYTLKTVDPKPLTIWATSPSDQEASFGISVSDVAVNSDIQILFDAPIDNASFAANLSIVNCGASSAGCSIGANVPVVDIQYVGYPSGASKAVVDVGPLDFDNWYRVTVTGGAAGVVSKEYIANCSASCEGGYLPQDYVIIFGTRSLPPLQAELISPLDGAQEVDIRPRVVLEFSKALSTATVTQYALFITDMTDNVIVEAFQNGVDYASGVTAEIYLDSDLAFDHEYNVVLGSSIQGVDGRFLAREVRFDFHTRLASALLRTDPANGESAVEVDLSQRENPGFITVYFDGAVTTEAGVTPDMAMTVTYQTDRGVAVLLGTIDTSTVGQWTMQPDPACTPTGLALDLNETYYINLSDKIWRASGADNLSGSDKLTFNTNTGPSISSVLATNDIASMDELQIDLVTGKDLAPYSGLGARDVPITATFSVTFNREVDQTTLTATGTPASDTLLLRAGDGTYADIIGLSWSGDGKTATFQADDATTAWIAPNPDLRYGTNYTLTLKPTVLDLDGNPLAEDKAYSFTTSVKPGVFFAATATPKDIKYVPGVTFSVPVVPATLNDVNFYVEESAGAVCTAADPKMSVLLDYGYDGRSAAVIPSPQMSASRCHTIYVIPGVGGPRDNRGNPFPGSDAAGADYTAVVNTSNQSNDDVSVNGTTIVDATALGGRQEVRVGITLDKSTGDFLPSSVNPKTYFVFEDLALSIPVDGYAYYDAANLELVFKLNEGAYFDQSVGPYYYALSANLSTAQRGRCVSLECDWVGRPITIENVRPNASSPVNGMTIEPDDVVTVVFDEPMRDASIGNLAVLNGATPVAGSWALDDTHTVATFSPAAPYSGGTTYTLTTSGNVQDYAGNLVNAYSESFAVTSVGPTLTSSVPVDGAVAIATNTDLTLTFNKPVDPVTILPSLWAGGVNILPGSVRLVSSGDPLDPLNDANAAAEVWACAYVNGNVVTLDPLDVLGGSAPYAWGVTTSVTDLGGNQLTTWDSGTFTTTP